MLILITCIFYLLHCSYTHIYFSIFSTNHTINTDWVNFWIKIFSEIGRQDPVMERNRDGDLRNFMHEYKLQFQRNIIIFCKNYEGIGSSCLYLN